MNKTETNGILSNGNVHNPSSSWLGSVPRRKRGSVGPVKGLFVVLLLGFSANALSGDKEAGEARYKKTCINCHGPAGKGAASYPKISGNDVSYTTSKLENYRAGIKAGPNSSLMFMFAKPLTDEEIANLAAYLKDAKYEN